MYDAELHNWRRSIMGNTLDKILKGFNKTIKQLDTFVVGREAFAEKMAADIEASSLAHDVALDEARKAKKIKTNVEGMIS